MKRVLTLLLALVLAVTSVPLSVSAFGSCATVAVDLSDTNYSESNVYVRTARSWSFLHPLEDGRMMTLNYIERQERIEVSYYTSDFVLQETLSIYPDLPIWGGFYATDDAYYLFTGQKNMDESPDVEVIRVTKYRQHTGRPHRPRDVLFVGEQPPGELLLFHQHRYHGVPRLPKGKIRQLRLYQPLLRPVHLLRR